MGEKIPEKYKDPNTENVVRTENSIVFERIVTNEHMHPIPILGYYQPYDGGIDIIIEWSDLKPLGGRYFKKETKKLKITVEVIE